MMPKDQKILVDKVLPDKDQTNRWRATRIGCNSVTQLTKRKTNKSASYIVIKAFVILKENKQNTF